MNTLNTTPNHSTLLARRRFLARRARLLRRPLLSLAGCQRGHLLLSFGTNTRGAGRP